MKKVNVAFVGLGQRGGYLSDEVLTPFCTSKLYITAVCDLYDDRAEAAADKVEKAYGTRPFSTTDVNDILKRDDVDIVIITAAWEAHVDLAVASMKAGKFTALEVGGAYTVEDCWKLVDTYEETKTPLFFMENCCYGKRELMVLNMARKGLFGNVVHCSGCYQHDIRDEISDGKEIRHYRLRNYIHRNCDNYPTHELAPVAKLMNVNNGNRLLTLTAMASNARGLHDYVVDRKGEDSPLAEIDFKQGDIISTTIKCSRGQTITLMLNTSLPAYYTRGLTVRGTKGMYSGDNDIVFIDKVHDHNNPMKSFWGNASEYEEEYLHDMWRGYDASGGHGGMDALMLHAIADTFNSGKKPPLDVYDAATYMCITPLTEKSIAMGGMPVDIPDFTRGKWHMRQDIEEWEHSFDIKNPYKDIY